ncbi:MAG: ATP synthase F0 subunit C [Fimbriimonadales bacterium]|nr:ATP synthase F0 subunit C [Fimbriimonadales bacterium]
MELGTGLYLLGLALAAGFLPFGVIGAGIGQGLAARGAMEGMARQPEMAGRIQTGMIIALAFIESLVLFSFLVFLLLQLKLPAVDTLVNLLRK